MKNVIITVLAIAAVVAIVLWPGGVFCPKYLGEIEHSYSNRGMMRLAIASKVCIFTAGEYPAPDMPSVDLLNR